MIFKRKLIKRNLQCTLLWCWNLSLITRSVVQAVVVGSTPIVDNELDETPEGYYAFVESPKMEPPQVKPPPYIKSNKPCHGVGQKRFGVPGGPRRMPLDNLCGDLNKGLVPANPMFQSVYGAPYPFELIKNKTLQFFSKTLPVLKTDETIPRIPVLQAEPQYYLFQHADSSTKRIPPERFKRSLTDDEVVESEVDSSRDLTESAGNSTNRQSRKFCDNDKGIFCLLFKLAQSYMYRTLAAQKRQDNQPIEYRTNPSESGTRTMDGPPTPCPARVEYATPVFARNYQGIWRYVVQIPYEGYFTQTVEVTKCINTRCHYMDGGCLSSPRWVSLLVAEIFYPETYTPINRGPSAHRPPILGENPPHANNHQNYNTYLHKRSVSSVEPSKSSIQSKKSHCDGTDEYGCFQVRLYFDWFLVPGSCKCWRPDYFMKYVRWGRRNEL